MAEPRILWVLGAVLVFVVLPMFIVAIRYRLHVHQSKKMQETLDELLNEQHKRSSKINRALQEKECSKNASIND